MVSELIANLGFSRAVGGGSFEVWLNLRVLVVFLSLEWSRLEGSLGGLGLGVKSLYDLLSTFSFLVSIGLLMRSLLKLPVGTTDEVELLAFSINFSGFITVIRDLRCVGELVPSIVTETALLLRSFLKFGASEL